ncbi:hypothetical protein ZIOFF_029495 [Zingiber officinale]|uniref:Leucine-rich repeat-containing N-terminal plant-type domain-containing protein n=2 Tax=Zingiber officinale TaxID=94328 RepID=A0A8J5GMT3_ZINOF|nr:hypothetical protein ZIOFF_029495 [Zingiber officinale]
MNQWMVTKEERMAAEEHRRVEDDRRRADHDALLAHITKACSDDHPHASKRINCLESERRALLAIKSDLYNSEHWLSSWIDYDCCKWRGVACDSTTNHVIRLDLHYPLDQYASFPSKTGAGTTMTEFNSSSNQIEGNIFVNGTRKLKHLDLAGNSFTKIPLIVGSLIHLKYLDLSSNDIIGGIPLSMGNLICLEYLDLQHNHITGELPLSMGNFTSLIRLDVSDNGFFGLIPDALGNLTSLIRLDVSDNEFFGRIPDALGNLTSLVYLNMRWNGFFGHIPDALGNLTSLIHLYLSSNKFYECIPDVLGNLINLKELHLFDNNISCQIPENIGRLHKLSDFDASGNNLNGQIPLSFGDLCKLKTLNLYENNISGELTNLFDGLSKCPRGSKLQTFNIFANKLSGSVPFSLGQLAQLRSLDISSNSLRNNMTDAHFSKLTNLIYLDISDNYLNLILSDDWLPPFHAEVIDMSYCHLGTRFPSWIQTQKKLTKLALSGVGLYGNISGWFDFIFNNSLFHLDISSNNLNGQIPSRLSTFMDLSNNSFGGTIALSYTKFEVLQVLKLSNNHISGSFPAFFCNFTNLRILQLSNNYLSGKIPNCHGSNPFNLNSLHMNNNNLSGPFPLVLRNSKVLFVLDLGGNRFSGEIPKWVGRSFPLLKILRLSSNSFHGAIPMSIVNLSLLQILDLSSNKLTGSIPSTIANFSSMLVKQNYSVSLHFSGNYSISFGCPSCDYFSNGDMEYLLDDNIIITAKGSTNEYTTTLSAVASIDLSNNELSGEIPKEITELHGLCFLNLSKNQLTGRIPENIGVMSELESLDLSMNRLTGEIPFSLSALNFLESLNLSYNNLSGKIPTGGQLSTFNDSTLYVGNEGLCGVPLPECPTDDANHSTSQIRENEEGDKLETILNYTFIMMGFIVGFWAYFGMIIMKKSMKVTLFQLVDKMYDWMYVQLRLKIAKLKLKWQK